MRTAVTRDAEGICLIYNHYIRTTTISFEETPVTAAEMAARIDEVAAAELPWLVEELNGRIVGFCYASKWKARAAYRHSVETTVYMAHDVVRKGMGTALYRELLCQVKERGKHVAIGGIALPNEASVRLHEKLGFRKVAEFLEVGSKFDHWVNVGYWETFL
ncbi:MAG TPA: arsinothricin resistance N-acetyltransferase ArsN1 family B [Steroidobacteraceae bacterium]